MPDALTEFLRTALGEAYDVERELGRGGAATVYLARDRKHDRPVAIKILKPDLAVALGGQRFLREIQILARLTHPHILPLHDSGEIDGSLYYVMPYVAGQSLRVWIKRESQLPLDDALRIAREVADALAFAHDHGVVHRDVKPENILLEAGHAVVADFGIARGLSRDGAERLTGTGFAIGTPDYMSPEQAGGEEEVDGRSDVYSLGVVLYEMLAGKPPVAGSSAQELMARRFTDPIPDLRRRRPALPEFVYAALGRALAPDPAERFPTAADLAEALTPVATTVPARSGAGGTRRRGWVAAVGAAVAALTAAGAWALHDGRKAPSADALPAIAVFPFAVRGDGDAGYLGEGMVDLLSATLDGAGDLRSVDPQMLLSTLKGDTPDLERAGRLARTLGARQYVIGSVLQVGDQLRISASLYDVGRGQRALSQASAEGHTDRVFALVDQLAVELLTDAAGGRLERVATLTSPSVPALKAYLTAESALRRGRYADAVDAFQRAIAADSTFALAYFRLSVAAAVDARFELADSAAAAAVRFGNRLSEHDRNVLLGQLASRRGAAAEAEQIFQSVLARYPDDVESLYELGEVLFHHNPPRGRSIGESRPFFERALVHEPSFSTSLSHLVDIAASEGRLDAFDSLLAQMDPESDVAKRRHGMRVLARGDSAEVNRLVREMREAGDGTILVMSAGAAAYFRDPVAALRLMPLLTDSWRPREVRAVGHVMVAQLELARGQWNAARRELARAEALDSVLALEYGALFAAQPFVPASPADLTRLRDRLLRWRATARPARGALPFLEVHDAVHPQLRLYLLGLLSARLGDSVNAESYAAQLGTLAARGSGSVTHALAQAVRAQSLAERGQQAAALAALEASSLEAREEHSANSPFYAQAHERYLRAQLLRALGRDREALRWFASLGQGRHELIYLAPAEQRQTEIYEQLGDRRQAARHRARAREIWRACDPEMCGLVPKSRE